MRRTAAVILAAGASTRFGSQKLLARLDGRPLLQHVLDAANASTCDDVVLVLGHDADALRSAVRLGRARAVTNAAYAEGQSTSLRAGVRAAGPADAVVVVLGDQPRVTPALIDRVLERQRATGAVAVMCVSGARRSPPTLLHRVLFAELERLQGDVGARELLRERQDVVLLEVDGGLDDVDRPDDLEGLGPS